MLLEKLLDLYEKSDDYSKRRNPGTGNPTGSALGKCAAALQLLRFPALSNPEPLSARAIMGFEEGDDVEQRMFARAKKVYGDNLVGFAQAVAFWSVPVTPDQALLITERMAMAYREPGAIWGRVVRGFRPPRARVREGRTLITPSYPIMVDRKTGFVLDPEAGLLWVPIQIDFALRHPELGSHIAEVKAVSEYEFRRALLGELSYQKRAQFSAIVDATGLPAFFIIQRKNTQHTLEISYSPSVAGKVRVKLLLNTRREEVFFVDGGALTREAGGDAFLPAEEEWTFGEVWTPYDPAILAECRERVVRVLTWDPKTEPYREYGPAPFTCEKCRGAGRVVCKQCKGTGETPKTKKPCGPCGGAKTVACELCGAAGQIAERTIPNFPCGYAVAPDTPILLADYSWRLASEMRAGDRVMTVTEQPLGRYRRMTVGTVQAVNYRRASAFRIETTGPTVVASSEHPWLVRSGRKIRWVETARLWRPDRTGRASRIAYLADPTEATDMASVDYRRGYLMGVFDGDGTFNRNRSWPQARLAMVDSEPLDRFQAYCAEFGIRTARGPFITVGGKRPMEKVWLCGVAALNDFDQILQSDLSTREAAAGYLAGIFDSEGHLGAYGTGKSSQRHLRISQKHGRVWGRIHDAIGLLKLRFRNESARGPQRVAGFRLQAHRGALAGEAVRFFSITRPALVRKTNLSVWGYRGLWHSVIAIAPLGERPLIDLTTSVGTFIAGGLVSHNCPVKLSCFAKAGVEKRFVVSRFGQRPAWVIGREAWEKAALPIHTPSSLRMPDLEAEGPMAEAGAPAQLALPESGPQ